MSSIRPFDSSPDFARAEDMRDPLRDVRDRFHRPIGPGGNPLIYFTGHSLGLQPLDVVEYVDEVICAWQDLGVDAHFRGENPWLHYMDQLSVHMAAIVGARSSEITFMNALTVNIHVLLASFYRPSSTRFKVLMERDAFPSDRYAVRSHLRLRGVDPDEAIVTLSPRPGEVLLRQEDIETTIQTLGQSIALIFLGGLNYSTGQLLDMEAIARTARESGCIVGFDLAHAAGNVRLRLHDWDVDFSVWCTYKYLNSGPGSPGGVFVHERHASDKDLPALRGWWGQSIDDRFKMLDDFVPARGAVAFQVSNPSILSLAPLRASLEQIDNAGFDRMLEKSAWLTAYLEYLILDRLSDSVQILTSTSQEERGAQLSIHIPDGRSTFEYVRSHGVSCDWREPGVIRMAPVPLYNSFVDVYTAVDILADAIEKTK